MKEGTISSNNPLDTLSKKGGDSSLNFLEEGASLKRSDLVVRFGHLGDVVLTTGVINYYGHLQHRTFDILTQATWAPLFLGNKFVNRVIEFPQGLSVGEEVAFFRSLSQEYKGKELLDLHGNLRSRMLRFLWKGKVSSYQKMGFERRLFLLSRGRICGNILRKYNVTQRYASAFLSGDIPSRLELLPSVTLQSEESVWAKKMLSEIYGSQYAGKVVAIHPFASHSSKTWSISRWKQMVDILDKKRIQWIALGVGNDIFSGAKQSVINKTSLRETAALLAESKLLLTGDSGPMHLASAVKIPVVAFFGPTTKEWGFYPAGISDIIIESEATCRPCSLHGKSKCNNPCLEKITPESVFRFLDC